MGTDIAGTPGGLEVETTGNGVYVKYFSCKKQARVPLALKG